MATRDGAVVEAQVGGQAAADVQRLALELDRQRAVGALHLEVLAGAGGLVGDRLVAGSRVEAGDRVEALGLAVDRGRGDHGLEAHARSKLFEAQVRLRLG